MTITTTLVDRHQKRSETLDTRIEQWRMIRDCIEGEDAIKAGDTTYLPKPSGMDPKNNSNGDKIWANYKARASYFGIVERTLLMLVGMAMRIEPIVSRDMPEGLQPVIDGDQGKSLNELAEWLFGEVLSIARCGVLVDMDADAGVDNLPYAAEYYAESIVEWVWQRKHGKRNLIYVKLAEDLVGDEQEFKDYDPIERNRELYLDENGQYTIKVSTRYVVNKKGIEPQEQVTESIIEPTFRGKRLDFIPFVIAPDLDDPKPMMLDLCRMSLSHYRNSADYEWSLFMTAQPTPWATGVTEDDEIGTLGPSKVWRINSSDAAVGMLEFKGAGLEAQRDAMRDKEDRMAVQGAYLIRGNVARNEKAETARLRNSGETSALRQSVNIVESTLRSVYRFAAIMMGLPDSEVDVTCNRDFIEASLGGKELTDYVKAWQGGGLSDEDYVNILKAGELVDATKTTEEVISSIEKTAERMRAIRSDTSNTGLGNESQVTPEQQQPV